MLVNARGLCEALALSYIAHASGSRATAAKNKTAAELPDGPSAAPRDQSDGGEFFEPANSPTKRPAAWHAGLARTGWRRSMISMSAEAYEAIKNDLP